MPAAASCLLARSSVRVMFPYPIGRVSGVNVTDVTVDVLEVPDVAEAPLVVDVPAVVDVPVPVDVPVLAEVPDSLTSEPVRKPCTRLSRLLLDPAIVPKRGAIRLTYWVSLALTGELPLVVVGPLVPVVLVVPVAAELAAVVVVLVVVVWA